MTRSYAVSMRRHADATLNKTRPRRSQPYQTMQLMQMNFFLEKASARFRSQDGKLRIDYARYHAYRR